MHPTTATRRKRDIGDRQVIAVDPSTVIRWPSLRVMTACPSAFSLIRRTAGRQADARDTAGTKQLVTRRGRHMSGSVDQFRRAGSGQV